MKKPSLIHDYLEKYAAPVHWKMHAADLDNIHQVVVIPAYAEKEMLFATLETLSENPEHCLKETLVICVINNKFAVPEADRINNAQTIEILTGIINRRVSEILSVFEGLRTSVKKIAQSSL